MNYTTEDTRIPLRPGDIVQIGAHRKYIIDKYVACGGFALMYIAHEERLGGSRFVALKELFPRNLDNALVQRMEDGKILAWDPFALDNEVEDENLQTELTKYFQREVDLTQKAGSVYSNDGQVEQQNNLDVLKVEGPFTDTKGNVYLAIDTYMGEPLRDLIEHGFVKNGSGKVCSNQHLLDVIDVLIETTIRLSSLHDGASMYHLDISPDNIYLAHSAGRTRYQPFIIDYGSAYDRKNSAERVAHRYTCNPFSAPEIIQLAELGSGCDLYVDESSDTFSVASILFYAATGRTFTSELRFFDDAWKEQIQHAYSLDIPSVSRKLSFADELIAFFKRGLATNQEKRYRSAKELVQALQKLKKSYQAYGNLLPLVEPDELMSYLVLQKHPLYEYRSEDGNIHVLCLGSGCFIKRMILSLISTGQMVDSHLFIHVVSKDAEQTLKSELCIAAPLLQEYSNILGHCDPQKEYVTFTFESVGDILEENTCRDIVTKYDKAHYYLISLGKNKQNIDAAKLYAKTILNSSATNRKTIINYYCSEEAANNYSGAPAGRDISPSVEIDAFADDLSSYSRTIRELGIKTIRLAHLYNKVNDPKARLPETAKALSENAYNQRSSCAAALHIFYKLASLGISTDENADSESIIEAYRQALSTDLFGKLLELEHRRWMMFMIAEQYSLPTERDLLRYGFELVDGNFNSSWKCTAKKLHPCLVPCDQRGITLSQDHWQTVFRKDNWLPQMKEAIDSSDLDPLDKVSLRLQLFTFAKCKHILSSGRVEQQFAYMADKLSGAQLFPELCSQEQERLIRQELDATQHFICTAIRLFSYTGDEGRLAKLQESFATVSINIENEIQQLRQDLSVFDEYSQQKDYKKFDAKIIRNIMWLLYSSEDLDLIKLLGSKGEKTASKIASALILDPRNITYIGKESHPELQAFLKKNNYAGSIRFVPLQNTRTELVEAHLKSVVAACTRRCVIDVTDAEETMIMAAQAVSLQNDHVSLIRSNSNGSIENLRNFPTASAYTLRPSLSARDVFSLHGAEEVVQDDNYMDRLGDHVQTLWNLYLEHRDQWEMITAFFAHPRCSGAGLWVTVSMDSHTQWETYFRNNIPKEKWDNLQLGPVFCQLESAGVLRNVVFGENATGKTITFEYPAPEDDNRSDYMKKAFNGLFGSKIHAANSPFTCCVTPFEGGKYSVDIKSESIVDCFCRKEDYSDKRQKDPLQEKRYPYAGMEPFLKQIAELGLITGLEIRSSTETGTTDIKFSYVDIAVKRCLVTAGNVLELYVWHQAKQTRQFADCAANFTFNWKEEGVKNELDVVVTAGLTTLLISCKTAKFNKDHLNEIKCLADKFSFNSKPVIVYSSKMAVENGHLTANLQPVKERARAMGVYLIDLNELEQSKDSLGEKLVRIANNLDLP